MTEESGGTDRDGRRAKRLSTPLQKYEIFLQEVLQEVTVIEAAGRWQVDRGVIVRIRRVGKERALDARSKSWRRWTARSRPRRGARSTRSASRSSNPSSDRSRVGATSATSWDEAEWQQPPSGRSSAAPMTS
jgi:hypothetical protein